MLGGSALQPDGSRGRGGGSRHSSRMSSSSSRRQQQQDDDDSVSTSSTYSWLRPQADPPASAPPPPPSPSSSSQLESPLSYQAAQPVDATPRTNFIPPTIRHYSPDQARIQAQVLHNHHQQTPDSSSSSSTLYQTFAPYFQGGGDISLRPNRGLTNRYDASQGLLVLPAAPCCRDEDDDDLTWQPALVRIRITLMLTSLLTVIHVWWTWFWQILLAWDQFIISLYLAWFALLLFWVEVLNIWTQFLHRHYQPSRPSSTPPASEVDSKRSTGTYSTIPTAYATPDDYDESHEEEDPMISTPALAAATSRLSSSLRWPLTSFAPGEIWIRNQCGWLYHPISKALFVGWIVGGSCFCLRAWPDLLLGGSYVLTALSLMYTYVASPAFRRYHEQQEEEFAAAWRIRQQQQLDQPSGSNPHRATWSYYRTTAPLTTTTGSHAWTRSTGPPANSLDEELNDADVEQERRRLLQTAWGRQQPHHQSQ